MILSCDPGLSGALCFSENGIVKAILDMPTMPKLTGKGNSVNAAALNEIISLHDIDVAYVERVHAMPKQGVSSTFEFGYGYGILHGVLAAQGIKLVLVTPATWKKHCGLIKKPKDAARSLAITLHPEVANQLNLKKHGGRADAICISDYAYHREK